MEPDPVQRTFEIIGRIMVAWAQVDRLLIAQTWDAKFPSGRWPHGRAQKLRDRAAEWAGYYLPSQHERSEFIDRVGKLVVVRDDLAHNSCEVEARNGEGLVFVMRLDLDWKATQRKAEKTLHLPVNARPDRKLSREYLEYSENTLSTALANIMSMIGEIQNHDPRSRPSGS